MSKHFQDISIEQKFGKTLRTYEVTKRDIDSIHRDGYLEIPEGEELYPNQPLVLKSGQASALAVVDKKNEYINLANGDTSFFGIRGRNKEQSLLLHLLDDPDIRVLVVTGSAGTGKTTCIGAYTLDQVMSKKYPKLFLSKPLEIVTKTRYWGTVPGDENDKFAPFLRSYQMMFENMSGSNGKEYVNAMINKKVIEFMPLELMRGASLRECICWYDEAQNLSHFETLTLGSRMDDTGGSKLILSGDLAQRDRNIARDRTGLMKLVNSPEFLYSEHTAHLNLVKNERGIISQLFHEVFEEEDDPFKD